MLTGELPQVHRWPHDYDSDLPHTPTSLRRQLADHAVDALESVSVLVDDIEEYGVEELPEDLSRGRVAGTGQFPLTAPALVAGRNGDDAAGPQVHCRRQRRRQADTTVTVPCVGQSNGGLLLHHDPNDAAGELGDGGARDVESYADFRALLGRIKPFARRILAEPPPNWFAPEWSDLTALLSKGLSLRRLGKRDMMQVLRFGPMCLADWLDERFDSSLLKCALAVPALHGCFGGPLSPGTCGAFFRYEALAGGAVVGGAAALVDSLSGAARACGVEILTDKSVSSITVSAGIVSGVVCEDGQSFDTGMVFSNVGGMPSMSGCS